MYAEHQSLLIFRRMPPGKVKKAANNKDNESDKDSEKFKDNEATSALERAMFGDEDIEGTSVDEDLEELQKQVQKDYKAIIANENAVVVTQKLSITQRSVVLGCLPKCAASQHAIARFQLTGTTQSLCPRKSDATGFEQ
jgi:hypothetical protein